MLTEVAPLATGMNFPAAAAHCDLLEQIALDWKRLRFQERVHGFPSRGRDGAR